MADFNQFSERLYHSVHHFLDAGIAPEDIPSKFPISTEQDLLKFLKNVREAVVVLKRAFRLYTIQNVIASFNGGKEATLIVYLMIVASHMIIHDIPENKFPVVPKTYEEYKQKAEKKKREQEESLAKASVTNLGERVSLNSLTSISSTSEGTTALLDGLQDSGAQLAAEAGLTVPQVLSDNDNLPNPDSLANSKKSVLTQLSDSVGALPEIKQPTNRSNELDAPGMKKTLSMTPSTETDRLSQFPLSNGAQHLMRDPKTNKIVISPNTTNQFNQLAASKPSGSSLTTDKVIENSGLVRTKTIETSNKCNASEQTPSTTGLKSGLQDLDASVSTSAFGQQNQKGASTNNKEGNSSFTPKSRKKTNSGSSPLINTKDLIQNLMKASPGNKQHQQAVIGETLIKDNMIEAVYFFNPNEFKEIQTFVDKFCGDFNLNMTRYDCGWQTGIAERVSTHSSCIVMGTRSTDPNAGDDPQFFEPSSEWLKTCCFMRCNPVLNWSYHDVWRFFLLFGLDYCDLYNIGFTSLGTVTDTEPNPTLKHEKANGEIEYLAAYLLKDGDLERVGRKNKKY